jgi:uncharacterized protein (DUF305 family)
MPVLTRLFPVVVLGLVAACQGPRTPVAAAPVANAPVATVTGPNGLSVAEMEAIWRARTDSARLRFTDADVRFMTGMIGHHAQAVGMSNLAPTNGASATIRTLAARIINAQQDEIALMQRWLRDRGQPVPEVHVAGHRVMVHGAGDAHAHHTNMPGMLTDAQMDALAAARGTEFDRLFLRSMIAHHKGAVVMVRELFATDGAGQGAEVFKFASDVQVDQTTEVARMERMLAAMRAAGPAR